MRAKVLKAYTDRLDGAVHLLGEEVELSAARAAELSAAGFVEPALNVREKPDYGSMSYNDLKKAAKGAGLSPSGKKAELVAALEAL